MTHLLTKSMSVLERSDTETGLLDGQGAVVFRTPIEEYVEAGDEGRIRMTIVQEHDWVALGRPEQLTVTIEPGDRLNV